jgi:hypothetical protein
VADDQVDFLLTTDGDLDITEADGLRFTTGLTAIKQGVRRRMQMFLGEWFLDESLGVDYWGSVLGQKFNEARVLQAFRPALLASPGVISIDSLSASFDGATRTVTVNWAIVTSLGKLADDLGISV